MKSRYATPVRYLIINDLLNNPELAQKLLLIQVATAEMNQKYQLLNFKRGC